MHADVDAHMRKTARASSKRPALELSLRATPPSGAGYCPWCGLHCRRRLGSHYGQWPCLVWSIHERMIRGGWLRTRERSAPFLAAGVPVMRSRVSREPGDIGCAPYAPAWAVMLWHALHGEHPAYPPRVKRLRAENAQHARPVFPPAGHLVAVEAFERRLAIEVLADLGKRTRVR